MGSYAGYCRQARWYTTMDSRPQHAMPWQTENSCSEHCPPWRYFPAVFHEYFPFGVSIRRKSIACCCIWKLWQSEGWQSPQGFSTGIAGNYLLHASWMPAFDIDFGLPKTCQQCRKAKVKCEDKRPCKVCLEAKQIWKSTIEPLTSTVERMWKIFRRFQLRWTGKSISLDRFWLTMHGMKRCSISSTQLRNSMRQLNSWEDFGPAVQVPPYHMTAVSYILSSRSTQGIVGDTVPDTVMRDATLYLARHGQTEGGSAVWFQQLWARPQVRHRL